MRSEREEGKKEGKEGGKEMSERDERKRGANKREGWRREEKRRENGTYNTKAIDNIKASGICLNCQKGIIIRNKEIKI